MQAAEHGRAVDSGGQLLAQGQVFEDEAVAVQGGPALSQFSTFAWKLSGGDQSSVAFEPAPRAADGGSNLGWVQGGPLVRRSVSYTHLTLPTILRV